MTDPLQEECIISITHSKEKFIRLQDLLSRTFLVKVNSPKDQFKFFAKEHPSKLSRMLGLLSVKA